MNWQLCSKKDVQNGWDVIVVAKNTILYHGTSADFPDDTVPDFPAFFGDLKTSGHYAFRGDKRRGEFGKIITLQLKEEVTLLNITEKNLDKLALLSWFPSKDFSYAFNYPIPIYTDRIGLFRTSHRNYDAPVSKFFSQSTFDGWGYIGMPGMHDEIVLCSNQKKVERYPVEYRFSTKFSTKILITRNGVVTEVKKVDHVGNVYFSSCLTYEPKQKSDEYMKTLDTIDVGTVEGFPRSHSHSQQI